MTKMAGYSQVSDTFFIYGLYRPTKSKSLNQTLTLHYQERLSRLWYRRSSNPLNIRSSQCPWAQSTPRVSQRPGTWSHLAATPRLSWVEVTPGQGPPGSCRAWSGPGAWGTGWWLWPSAEHHSLSVPQLTTSSCSGDQGDW